MDSMSIAELITVRHEWDACVDETDGVDPWSSGSDWALNTHATWGSGPEVVLRSSGGFAAFGRVEADAARALVGLDPMWAFASPIVGPDLARLCLDVSDVLNDDPEWDLVFLTGLAEGSALDRECIRAFGRHHQLFAGPEAIRLVANISDMDAWWNRRGQKFRRNIRKSREFALGKQLRIDVVDHLSSGELMKRLLAVEATSWKGLEESGLLGSEMSDFYARMAIGLGAEGRMRAAVAVLDGTDVGYILGAIRGDTYRGLQVSFSVGYESLSIGHLLQDHEIHRVSAQGVLRYDLGMDIPYKHHWADGSEATRTIIVRR